MEAQLKVSRAITMLACQDPFFGSCALRLNVHEDGSIEIMGTDGTYIKWNKEFIDSCTENEVAAAICHEVLHVLFEHCTEVGDKDVNMSHIAKDLVINEIIQNETSYDLPASYIKPEKRFYGKTWEQIYGVIKNEDKYKNMAKEAECPCGDLDDNKDLSEAEKAELSENIKQMVTSATDLGEKQGKPAPGAIQELVSKIRAPQVNWKEEMESTIRGNNPDDYTWKKFNRKMFSEYDICMPTTESKNIGNIVVGIDTSGSVSQRELESFLSELHDLFQTCNFESVILIYNDSGVASTKTFFPGDDIRELEVTGRGGTCFKPVFKYVEEMAIEVDQMLFFSDMEVWEDNFPKKVPYYPVLWLSTSVDYSVPFGRLIKIK